MNGDGVEIVEAAGDGLGDALSRLGVRLVGGVHRERGEQTVGVPEAVEVVEVDVGDEGRVGEVDVAFEELGAKVRAGVDQQRLAGALVVDVDGEASALDVVFAGVLAGVTVTARRRRPGGISGSQQRDLHRPNPTLAGGLKAAVGSRRTATRV